MSLRHGDRQKLLTIAAALGCNWGNSASPSQMLKEICDGELQVIRPKEKPLPPKQQAKLERQLKILKTAIALTRKGLGQIEKAIEKMERDASAINDQEKKIVTISHIGATMKFTIDQALLNEHVNSIAAIAPVKPSHAILGSILFDLDSESDQITMTTFDLELGITLTVDAEVDGVGKLAIPAKFLSDVVAKLPSGDVTVELSTDDELLVIITCGSASFSVPVLRPDEYPELPTIENGTTVELPAQALRTGLSDVAPFTSADPTKFTLCGVHILADSDGLEFAATDGHQLSVSTVDGQSVGQDLEIIVPSKSVSQINKALKSLDDKVKIELDSTQLKIELENKTIVTRLLDGQFPNYNQLIPSQFKTTLTVNRKLFLDALSRIAIVSGNATGVVRLTLKAEEQELELESTHGVSVAHETIAAESSDDFVIAMDVKKLTNGVKTFDCEYITINMNTATSPCVINADEKPNLTHLIMPVQIRQ